MNMNTGRTKFEKLKTIFGLGIASGVIIGFIFGIAKALLFMHSNRYFELGMYNIAFFYFRSIVNYSLLIFTPSTLALFFGIFFIYLALAYFLKDPTKGERYARNIVETIILVGLFLIVGLKLNKSAWYPHFFSLKGFLYNVLTTIIFVCFGFILFKLSTGIYSFLLRLVRKIPHFRFACVALLLLLLLNVLFYYRQIRADRNGLNVLLITVDTLRADHLGAYGYVRNTSPNMDRLAKEGILFSQAMVQWPKTKPSLTSMLTSTYGHYNGIMRVNDIRQKVNSSFVLLSEILKNDDYNTVAIVTNGNLAAAYNFDQGFDTHIEVGREHKRKEAEYVNQYALSWLKENSNKGKFFMWLHYVDPHAKYQPPGSYNEMYLGDEYYEGSKTIPINNASQPYPDMKGIWPPTLLGTRQELDYYIAQYDAEIRYTDENIGEVLDTVKALGFADNTIVILTADHGESLGEHDYYFEHGRLPYDSCVRVPLIIKVPGLKSEVKVVEHPVELIDIMPTVLDVFKLSSYKQAQGRSLMPLMLGNSDIIPRYVFTEAGYRDNYQRVIRTKKWKLIYIPDEEDQAIMQGMPFELYDIENDPGELNNLINVETKIASELQKELFNWMESANEINQSWSPEGNVKIDEATEENLRSLGYIE